MPPWQPPAPKKSNALTLLCMKTFEVRLTTGLTGYIPADSFAEEEGWLRFRSGQDLRPIATYPSSSVARVKEYSPTFDDSAYLEGSKFDD